MNKAIITIFILLSSHIAKTDSKPNIVFILLDDAGLSDISYYVDYYDTPNIDSIFRLGIKLSQYHKRSTCTPARSALLSGIHPMRYGLNQSMVQSNDDIFYKMPRDTIILSEYLRQIGYTTGIIGKWHLGNIRMDLPPSRGFDYSFISKKVPKDYYTWSNSNNFYSMQTIVENGYPVQSDSTYLIDKWYDKAANFINHSADNFFISKGKSPFFLYLADTSPRAPNIGKSECVQTSNFKSEFPEHFNKHSNPTRLGRYCQMKATDEGIGKIIQCMKRKGILDNTLIIITSDNEAVTNIENNWNHPYKSGKGRLYEGGTHVFCTMYQKNKYENMVINEQIDVTDWLPTILNIVEFENISKSVHGVSFKNLIDGHLSKKRNNIILDYTPGRRWGILTHNGDKIGVNLGNARGVPLSNRDIGNLEIYNLYSDEMEEQNLKENTQYNSIEALTDSLDNLYDNWQSPNKVTMKYFVKNIRKNSSLHDAIHYTSLTNYGYSHLIAKIFHLKSVSRNDEKWNL